MSKRVRVSLVRIVTSDLAYHESEMPETLNYPDAYVAREFLFRLVGFGHVLRMDARDLSPAEFERMRNNDYQPSPRRTRWDLLMLWVGYQIVSAAICIALTAAWMSN